MCTLHILELYNIDIDLTYYTIYIVHSILCTMIFSAILDDRNQTIAILKSTQFLIKNMIY